MKSKILNSILLLLFFCCIGNIDAATKELLSKEIAREFTIKPNGTLAINNKYGKVHIVTSVRTTTSIKVEISADAEDKRSQETIDNITVQFSESAENVVATTVFTGNKIGRGVKNFSIDYTIEMPLNVRLDITNKFGDFYLNATESTILLNLQYGDGKIGTAGGTENNLVVEFGKLNVDVLKKANVVVSYSDFVNEKANLLTLKSRFSTVNLLQVGSLTLNSQYDNVKIVAIGKLVADNKFTDMKISKLTQELRLENEYGDIEIDLVSKGFTSIVATNSFADFDVIFAADASYSFDLSASFAEIDLPSGANISIREKEQFKEKKKGTVGSTSSSTVSIKSSYGDIELE